MAIFILRRLGWNVLVLLGVALTAFLLMHAIPGSPWNRVSGERALKNIYLDENTRKALDRHFGLDQPLWRQFTAYILGDSDEAGIFTCGVVCGNFGPSYRQRGRSVQDILFSAPENGSFLQSRFAYSIRLALLALVAVAAGGILSGIQAALHQNSLLDRAISFTATIGMSIPNFVLGLVLLILFASGLGLITIRANWSEARSWAVPVIVLAVAPAGLLSRLTRTSILDVLHEDYIRTAHSKGLTRQTVTNVHVLRNAMVPLVAYLGPIFLELVAGSFVIEAMFGFPGMGREYWEAVVNLDYSMIMAVTLLDGAFLVLANLGVDILYAAVDPRIRTF